MPTYIIKGGKKLSGTIDVCTAKNSAVAIMCATLLFHEKVTLTDIPLTQETERMSEILRSIGVVCVREGTTLIIDPKGPLCMDQIDRSACERIRTSLLLFGALAAREKTFKVYKSGGCKLGERTIRPHIYALNSFGIDIASTRTCYTVTSRKLQAADVIMYEAGDTPTENAVMAAVLAPGVTHIKFASANYMVQDLCFFLVAAGAKIQGIGTSTLTITGVTELRKTSYAIMPDPIEAMAFISLGITTNSRLTIKNCPIDFLELELEKLKIMGQKFIFTEDRMSKNKKFRIVDIDAIPSSLRALPDKIHPQPFPGINIDNLPLFAPIFTRSRGRTLSHDWVYENRAIYSMDMQKLGANVMLLDPHRLLIEGPTPLTGAEMMCPPAIRSAVALLIAMLAAKGKSVLRDTYPIERAHERIIERLQAIGADIHVEKN